jgi:hypothetical protein
MDGEAELEQFLEQVYKAMQATRHISTALGRVLNPNFSGTAYTQSQTV